MAVEVTCTGVAKNAETGQIDITFNDGSGLSFDGIGSVKQFGSELDSPQSEGIETAKRLLIRWWIARSPEGNNANLIIGKRVEFDLSAAAPLKFT
jgi:hypothetical protein